MSEGQAEAQASREASAASAQTAEQIAANAKLAEEQGLAATPGQNTSGSGTLVPTSQTTTNEPVPTSVTEAAAIQPVGEATPAPRAPTAPPPEAPPSPPPAAKVKADPKVAPALKTTARPGEKAFTPFRGVRFAPAFRPGRATLGPDFTGEGKKGRADTRGGFDPSLQGAKLNDKEREDGIVKALGEA